LEQVVLTALAKDPHQRFASVQAFATALEQASQPSAAPSETQLPTKLATQVSQSYTPTKLVAPMPRHFSHHHPSLHKPLLPWEPFSIPIAGIPLE
jgi:hypothetical protein